MWVIVLDGGSLMWCIGLYVNIIWALCEDFKILLMSIVYVIYKIP